MKRIAVALLLVAGATLILPSHAGNDDEELKKARKDLLDLTKDIERRAAEKDIDAKAKKVSQKHKALLTLMHGFKPGSKGGIGYGRTGVGIEQKLLDLSRRAPSAALLTKEKAELTQLANVTLALTALTRHYGPARAKGPITTKRWAKYTSDLRTAATNLRAAVVAVKPADVKSAASSAVNACNNCHALFRDGEIVRRFPAAIVNEEVLELADGLRGKRDIATQAADVAKDHAVKDVMEVFKARAKGSIGLGANDAAIEDHIAAWRKTALGKAELERKTNNLLLGARISIAVAEVVGAQQPAPGLSAWRQRVWKRYAEDLARAGRGLQAAVEKNDAKRVQAAALRLHNACLNCHADFRDR